MSPEQLADTAARHAVPLLLAIAACTLAGTAVVWHLVHRYGYIPWRWTMAAWQWLAAHRHIRRVGRAPVIGPLATRSLSLGRYLGLYAIAAFAVALAGFAIFFEVADEIGVNEELARFDAALAAALRSELGRGVLELFAAITHLGDVWFLVVVATLVALVLLLRGQRLLALIWAIGTGSGALLNRLLKAVFERARPLHDHGVAVADGFSFPSGHASGSMLVYGLLGYLIVINTPRAWHIPIAASCAALVVFVGFSRVMLQVHYFSDVLAGYATGAAWVALCIGGMETIRWRVQQRARTDTASVA